MSRVADALRRAEQAGLPLADGTPEPPCRADVDVSDVAVPWEVQAAPEHERSPSGLHVVPPPAAPAATHQAPSREFVELVQRVFRPAAGEPTARSVTFVAVGVTGARRPIALEVASTLAGHGVGTVCVVDASFGATALHEHAGLPAGPGLCDALLESRSAASLAVALERQQLWLVPAGDEMCAAPGWLPEALARALRQVSARFDFVIVEAPPLDDVSGMATLLTVASLTDGVVLVLEATGTRRDVAADVATRLRASGVSVLGAVLVAPAPSPRRPRGWRNR